MNGMKGMDEQRETVRLEHAQAARMYNVDRIDAYNHRNRLPPAVLRLHCFYKRRVRRTGKSNT